MVEHEGWRIRLDREKGDVWCGRKAQRRVIARYGRRSIPVRSRMLKGEVVHGDGILVD